MAKMQVYEIAREVNKKSREIISFLNDNGINITSHMSNIDEKAINLIRKEFGSPKKTNNQIKSKTNRDTKDKSAKPQTGNKPKQGQKQGQN